MPRLSIGLVLASLFLFQAPFNAKALEVCGLDVAGNGIDRAHIKTCEMIKAGAPGYAINSVKKSGVEYTVSLSAMVGFLHWPQERCHLDCFIEK